jgi:hypothetical protein
MQLHGPKWPVLEFRSARSVACPSFPMMSPSTWSRTTTASSAMKRPTRPRPDQSGPPPAVELAISPLAASRKGAIRDYPFRARWSVESPYPGRLASSPLYGVKLRSASRETLTLRGSRRFRQRRPEYCGAVFVGALVEHDRNRDRLQRQQLRQPRLASSQARNDKKDAF